MDGYDQNTYDRFGGSGGTASPIKPIGTQSSLGTSAAPSASTFYSGGNSSMFAGQGGSSAAGFERGSGGYLAYNQGINQQRYGGEEGEYGGEEPTVVNLSSSPPQHDREQQQQQQQAYNNHAGAMNGSPFRDAAADADRRLHSLMQRHVQSGSGIMMPDATPLDYHGKKSNATRRGSSYGRDGDGDDFRSGSHDTSPPSSNAPQSDDEGDLFSAALVRHAARELGVDYLPSTGTLPNYKNSEARDPRTTKDGSWQGRHESIHTTRRILENHTDVVFEDDDIDPLNQAPLTDDPWMGEHFRVNMSPDFRFLGGPEAFVNTAELERQIELRERALGPSHLSVASLRLQLAEHHFMCANSKQYAQRNAHAMLPSTTAAAAEGGHNRSSIMHTHNNASRSSGAAALRPDVGLHMRCAEAQFLKVIAIFAERYGGPLASELVPLYSKLGTFYMAGKRYAKAAEAFEEAKACAERCEQDEKEREEYTMLLNADGGVGMGVVGMERGVNASGAHHQRRADGTMVKTYPTPSNTASATQLANKKLRGLIGALRASDPSLLSPSPARSGSRARGNPHHSDPAMAGDGTEDYDEGDRHISELYGNVSAITTGRRHTNTTASANASRPPLPPPANKVDQVAQALIGTMLAKQKDDAAAHAHAADNRSLSTAISHDDSVLVSRRASVDQHNPAQYASSYVLTAEDKALLGKPSTLHGHANLTALLAGKVADAQEHKRAVLAATNPHTDVDLYGGGGKGSGGGANPSSDIVASTQHVLQQALATASKLREQRLLKERERAADITAALNASNTSAMLTMTRGGASTHASSNATVATAAAAAASPVKVRFQFSHHNGDGDADDGDGGDAIAAGEANVAAHVGGVISALGKAGMVHTAHHSNPSYRQQMEGGGGDGGPAGGPTAAFVRGPRLSDQLRDAQQQQKEQQHNHHNHQERTSVSSALFTATPSPNNNNNNNNNDASVDERERGHMNATPLSTFRATVSPPPATSNSTPATNQAASVVGGGGALSRGDSGGLLKAPIFNARAAGGGGNSNTSRRASFADEDSGYSAPSTNARNAMSGDQHPSYGGSRARTPLTEDAEAFALRSSSSGGPTPLPAENAVVGTVAALLAKYGPSSAGAPLGGGGERSFSSFAQPNNNTNNAANTNDDSVMLEIASLLMKQKDVGV